jgi:hypothetical protein
MPGRLRQPGTAPAPRVARGSLSDKADGSAKVNSIEAGALSSPARTTRAKWKAGSAGWTTMANPPPWSSIVPPMSAASAVAVRDPSHRRAQRRSMVANRLEPSIGRRHRSILARRIALLWKVAVPCMRFIECGLGRGTLGLVGGSRVVLKCLVGSL